MAETTCWADPLTSKERAEVARMLARACKSFYGAAFVRKVTRKASVARQLASAEMSDLHLDVTERAAVPAR
jgi:alkylhydroperoxidase family enzyme